MSAPRPGSRRGWFDTSRVHNPGADLIHGMAERAGARCKRKERPTRIGGRSAQDPDQTNQERTVEMSKSSQKADTDRQAFIRVALLVAEGMPVPLRMNLRVFGQDRDVFLTFTDIASASAWARCMDLSGPRIGGDDAEVEQVWHGTWYGRNAHVVARIPVERAAAKPDVKAVAILTAGLDAEVSA